MNYKQYINIMLLKLSDKYQCNLTDIKTYKKGKRYNSIKLTLYKYDEEDENEKHYYKTLEFRNERELILKLKEMM